MRRIAAVVVGTLVALGVFTASASAEPDPMAGDGAYGTRIIDQQAGDTSMVMPH
ncbi:hypothetical protein K2224_01810 [Streptomyces sp. BHT-5-2]|uniref:hypothetical protein n=1 Tax=unclassified Streptomyces TaxID=2593676 RepID=UPI001C8EBE59|nr:hypothetical protein [Streptomyces sp. BHT-5-2]QZL02112.1 hypothetical protein K2224_01810 [Streptomyces sp. BHT-5-2]